MQDLQVQGCLL